MSYVYIRSEPSLWTVGHYTPDGEWKPESDHDSPAAAAERTARLNGGGVGVHRAVEMTNWNTERPSIAWLSSDTLLRHVGHELVVNAHGRSGTMPGTEQVGVRLDSVQLHCQPCDVDLVSLVMPDNSPMRPIDNGTSGC